MASYTIRVNSSESSARFFSHKVYYSGTNVSQDAVFNFNLPNLKGTTVKSVSVTAPVISTEDQGGYGDFTLKFGNTTLNNWTDSTTTVWSASDLSLVGTDGGTAAVELKHTEVNHWWDSSSSRYRQSYTGRELGRAVLTIVVEGEFTESTVYPISGEAIPKSLENTFSWTQTIIQGSVVGQKLYWKTKDADTYTEINLNIEDTSYTFPAHTFNVGEIMWYVEGVDDSGNIATSTIETVTVGITPSSLNIAYPKDVNIRNANVQVFTWELQEPVATGQKSYEIQYKAAQETKWTVVSRTSANQYHEFAPNTFNTDTYEWKVRVTNNDDITTDFVSATFVAIGSTDAPDIKEITNSAIPTVRWEISSQDTFEMEIFAGDTRLYASGVQVGTGIREFTPNIMLEDGNYIVKMRVMNEYGYFTDWADYSFVLNAEKPEPVECIAYANEYHGVNITKGDGNAENLFVLRREFGVSTWEIMGKLKNNEIFIDNTPIKNKKYEYALRNHKTDEGFADSNIVSMVIDYNGLLIYDENEFVQLFKTEDSQFDIAHTPSKNYSYSYTIGRKYPVRESSEWMSHSVSLSCFVLFEDYKKLEAFYDGNDDLWFKDKEFSFKCAIDGLQIKETLLGKGYSISIDLSRTDENEVNLIE